jgi:hypothetical protein
LSVALATTSSAIDWDGYNTLSVRSIGDTPPGDYYFSYLVHAESLLQDELLSGNFHVVVVDEACPPVIWRGAQFENLTVNEAVSVPGWTYTAMEIIGQLIDPWTGNGIGLDPIYLHTESVDDPLPPGAPPWDTFEYFGSTETTLGVYPSPNGWFRVYIPLPSLNSTLVYTRCGNGHPYVSDVVAGGWDCSTLDPYWP